MLLTQHPPLRYGCRAADHHVRRMKQRRECTMFGRLSDYLKNKAKDRVTGKIQPQIERFAILERQAEACAMDAEARLPIWQEMMSISQYISEQVESARGLLEGEEYLKIKKELAAMHDAVGTHSVR